MSGVTVLDFSTNVAGPYASMMLSDLGARVVKVEPPTGDPARYMDPPLHASSAVFEALNRGKQAVSLNLKEDAGRDAARRLLRQSDVLIENFRPGVMDNLGFGYEAVHAEHDSLVYCSISGFGYESDAARDVKAYDPLIQAFAGHLEMTGSEGGGPARSGASIVDVSAGMWAAVGILAALRLAPADRGRHLQVSLLDSLLAVMSHQVTAVSSTGVDIPRLGTDSPLLAPYGSFATADKPIMLAVGNGRQFRLLTEALGSADLVHDRRFRTNGDRVSNRRALREVLETRLRSESCEVWIDRLRAAGIPCGPVNTLLQALEEPLVRERGSVGELRGTGVTHVRNPLRVDREPLELPAGIVPFTATPFEHAAEGAAREESHDDPH